MSYSSGHARTVFGNLWNRVTLRKPMAVIEAENNAEKLARTLGLFDLLMIGIGGTVGSGIFATAAEIVGTVAGPAAILSWMLAGIGCMLSGLSFMEMSTRVPSSGSTYAYSYHAIGEWAAVLSGWLLTLEYGISGAGVARSWGSKLSTWITDLGGSLPGWLDMNNGTGGENQFGFFAALMMLVSVIVVGLGMQIGKQVMNGITLAKIAVVLFIIFVGLSQFSGSNLTPFVPDRETITFAEEPIVAYGFAGVMLGASKAFFGYIGYDEVCCLSGETRNPIKTMPKAVMGVIMGTCFLSVGATFALAGMISTPAIVENTIEGFASAFRTLGLNWAADITAAGEVLTMPVVVLISFLAQPRLLFVMAEDGMLPSIFARVEKNGVLLYGTIISGIVMIIIAMFVKFDMLWDLITLGILTSFTITNTCVVFARYREHSPRLAPSLWGSFTVLCLIGMMILQHYIIEVDEVESWATILSIIFLVASFLCVAAMVVMCSRSLSPNPDVWMVPLTPLPQFIAISFNWFLFSQVKWESVQWYILYLAIAFASYAIYGLWFSIGNNTGWSETLDADVPHKASLIRNSFTSGKEVRHIDSLVAATPDMEKASAV